MRERNPLRYICTSIVATLVLAAFAVADTHTVLANDTSFAPDAIDVAPGDTIIWQYNSGYPHTVTSGIACAADGLFHGELQNGGDTFTWEVPLDASGDIPYFCEPHCGMGMDGIITILSGPTVLNVPADYPTIESAILAATPGNVIAIAQGTYYESGLMTGVPNLTITGAIDANGSPAVTIDGQGTANILLGIGQVDSSGTTVENITFTGSIGNALWIYHYAPTIRNCTFTGITSEWEGAAIWSSDSEALIEDCRFVGNDAGDFGNILFNKSISGDNPGLLARSCSFEDNAGHAIAQIRHTTAGIQGCTFRNNTATAAISSAGMVMVSDTLFCENDAAAIEGPWDDGGGNEFGDVCPVDCPGDLNGDATIGVDDLLTLLEAFQASDGGDCDGDGDTDVDDLLLLVSAWGDCL
jgi:plastocyanin